MWIYCHSLTVSFSPFSHAVHHLPLLAAQLLRICSHVLWHPHREQHPNMSGLLVLFCGLHILGALLSGADGSGASEPTLSTTPDGSHASPAHSTSAASGSSEASSTTSAKTLTTVSSLSTGRSTAPPPGPQHRTTATTTTVAPNWLIYRKECLVLYMASGGLILLCTVLLLSTLVMTWKVRHLSRRLKALSSNADLISNCEYWMGTARKSKSKSETEAKETGLLMTGLGQTQEDVGAGGATKGEGGEVNGDGQMRGENKKLLGDTVNGEEASAGVDETVTPENPSSEKPQEDATDSLSSKAVAADSSSEGTDGPKVKV